MNRWHREQHIGQRRAAERAALIGAPRETIAAGKYRKRDAHDCGKTRCYVCHSAKLDGEPRKRDRIAEIRAAEERE